MSDKINHENSSEQKMQQNYKGSMEIKVNPLAKPALTVAAVIQKIKSIDSFSEDWKGNSKQLAVRWLLQNFVLEKKAEEIQISVQALNQKLGQFQQKIFLQQPQQKQQKKLEELPISQQMSEKNPNKNIKTSQGDEKALVLKIRQIVENLQMQALEDDGSNGSPFDLNGGSSSRSSSHQDVDNDLNLEKKNKQKTSNTPCNQ